MKIEEFVEKYGEPYSAQLGINLAAGRNEEFVKWFLASILYAKPIRNSASCNDNAYPKAHADLQTAQSGIETCIVCHEEGADFGHKSPRRIKP